MEHYRMDNTEGYTEAQLTGLNTLATVMGLDDVDERDDNADYKHLSEQVLSAYDNGQRANHLTDQEIDDIMYHMDSEDTEAIHSLCPRTGSDWLKLARVRVGEKRMREYAELALPVGRVVDIGLA